jgi:hypothetical protein
LKSLIFEALGLEKLKPKVARLRLDVCWLVPSLCIIGCIFGPSLAR